MSPARPRRARPFAVLLAPAFVAIGASTSVAAAPPTLPPGYVQLVDDTGRITVAVPETWTDIDTAPAVNADGSPQPYIAAAPDLDGFYETFDVPGVLYAAFPFQADGQTVIDQYGLSTECDTVEVVPYDDGAFAGIAQTGTGCGPGDASWTMVVASPADQSMTAVVQVQTATAADSLAMETVLATFNLTAGTAAPPGSPVASSATPVPGAIVPSGLGPVEVGSLFLDSLAAGDGATACALLALEEMTINFVENAESCAAELSAQVAGQGEFWASVQISGNENTSSPGQCGEEEAGDDYVSLELQGPSDDGCLSIGQEANGEWRIEDLSNSIWNQAPG
jgi:hypothetical protein